MNQEQNCPGMNPFSSNLQEVADLSMATLPAFEVPAAELVAQVRALLSDELGLPQDLEDSEGIFSGRYLQSIDVVTIILLLRERFGITVRPDEVNLSNFDSIALITHFIERSKRTERRETI
jgi:acyl carrier protein